MKKDKKVAIAKDIKVSKKQVKKMEDRPGGSNVGNYKDVSKKDFAGPKGDAPQGSFPINSLSRAKAALKLAHNAPDPEGIKLAVYKRFPELRKNKKERIGYGLKQQKAKKDQEAS